MSITFVGAQQATSGNASVTSITVAKPNGVQAGHVMFAMVCGYAINSVTKPAGWTLIDNTPAGAANYSLIYYKVATGSEPSSYQWTPSASTYMSAVVVAYSGVDNSAPVNAHSKATGTSTTVTAPSCTTTVNGAQILALLDEYASDTSQSVPLPAGLTQRAFQGSGTRFPFAVGDAPQSAKGATPTYSSTTSAGWYWAGFQVALAPTPNQPPNAPTLTSPANNATIDRSITQRFAWLFSDPDAGDSQSKFDLQWWALDGPGGSRVGSATTVTDTVPNNFHDFAAGYWAAGNFEWQVRTYDSQGVVGPWSSSSFFTAATAPTPPTITAPTSGGTVSSSETVTWSEPNQDSYQIRRVADNAGSADSGTVYYDSGEVVSATARSVTLTFETNNRWEHIQLRVKYSGLWSTWTDIRVDVSYTPPPGPTVALTPYSDAGLLDVAITNPAPGAGEPAVSYNDVYVDDGQGLGWERVATMLTPSTAYTYLLPVSGRDYSGAVKVVSVATNGTTAETIA